MDATFTMGVDIGTSSTKAVVYDVHGWPIGRAAAEYPLRVPVPGAAEQDPEQIVSAVIAVMRDALQGSDIAPAELAGVGLAAAMHTLIAVDEGGHALTPCFTWADDRAAASTRQLDEEADIGLLYERTGVPVHPMSPLVKLRWLRQERPAVFDRAARFMSIKEFVLYRLFGRAVIDPATAAASGLWNLVARDWDPFALALTGVTRERLSVVVDSTSVFRDLAPVFADAMRLPRATPFVVGTSDGVAGNLGLGAIAPGRLALNIGTSGAIRGAIDRPVIDARARSFCYPLAESRWIIGTAINNGGLALRWARDKIGGSVDYEMLTRAAEQVPPGAEGLLFHPYLAGERAPLWNAEARASFIGLGLHHGQGHMIRAVLEGVVFNLHNAFHVVDDLVGRVETIRASGGFARSALWCQIVADVFAREVRVPVHGDSVCMGAALLCRYALGHLASLDAVDDLIGPMRAYVPDDARSRFYARLVPLFEEIPARLTEVYARLAAFRSGAKD